jgi:hypothetical protein
MPSSDCPCTAFDPAAAKKAIRAGSSEILRDESHFIISIRRCSACGQHFLGLFCERVDWADGDDPQSRLFVVISEAEAQELRGARATLDEPTILALLHGVRRILVNDMPKGASATIEWRERSLWIPPHD